MTARELIQTLNQKPELLDQELHVSEAGRTMSPLLGVLRKMDGNTKGLTILVGVHMEIEPNHLHPPQEQPIQ